MSDWFDKKFNNEEEYETFLFNHFKNNEWEVYRQVLCDETKHLGDKSWRLDLIARPKNSNIPFIGFELKMFDAERKGGAFFDALHQLIKYKGKTFMSHKINWICLCCPKTEEYKDGIFMQTFLQKIGIATLINNNSIEFLNNDGAYKLKIFDKYNSNLRFQIEAVNFLVNNSDNLKIEFSSERKKGGKINSTWF